MSFPLYYFLFFYGFFVFVWAIFCLIAIYHMFKFGFRTFATFFFVFLFITGCILLFYFWLGIIKEIDWKMYVSVFSSL